MKAGGEEWYCSLLMSLMPPTDQHYKLFLTLLPQESFPEIWDEGPHY